MDLKALVQTHENIAQKRKSLGHSSCEEAYQLLLQAESTGYQDKDLLKQASALFIRAIRQERTFAEPYIGLGYLLLLISDFQAAEQQLKAALRFSPGNPDAEKLLKFLYQKKTGTLPKHEKVPSPQAPKDYNQLFDKLENLLHEQLVLWHKQPPPIPAIEAADLEALKKKQALLEQLCQRIEQELTIIDEDIDIGQLQRLATPLFQWRDNYNQVLKISETFKTHKQTLDALSLNVKMALLQLKEENDLAAIKVFEAENLEQILDDCDAFADILDDLERQGHDILALEQPYHILVLMIENLQTLLDEKAEELT